MPIGHVLVKTKAADFPAMVDFYTPVLEVLGLNKLPGFPDGMTAFGKAGPEWVILKSDESTKVHVAFQAPDEDAVNKFHSKALASGAKDNGEPGRRPHIHPNYHAAFIIDPVGNNVEAACIVP